MITVEKPADRIRRKKALLSVVIPIYQEGDHIKSSVKVIEQVLIEHGLFYEFILVDDGSKDNTWSELKSLAGGNDRMTAIRLSRNFGKESAICAGLEYAGGDMVLVMDADLQHPPDLIPRMVDAWMEGYDVVEGIKHSRGKENFAYKLCARFFYYIIYKSSDIHLGHASDYKLLDRKVVEAWKKLPERAVFFRGMSAWLGFERKEIEFDVAERVNGTTKWSLFRLLKLALNAITSYTSVPLHFITLMGTIMFIGSVILGIQTLIMKFTGKASEGFTTVILLQLIIGSAIMTSLGIIGIYISKIYKEVKARPRYLISEYYKGGDDKC
ncbi:MAG TPA: glycosyltransferase family 2 protein [Mobilitalea sp.]|nr:glycosyltransferase family 2 protein [Mobilitalea sp.]